ncbi:MAG: hypothetical protein WC671_01660 [Candidatus Paceibacterota bacterium]|jgi:hypothetical protein
MFKEEKNIKDSIKDTSSSPVPYRASGFGMMSYTKTNKLITALYMVTDIIDKDEPLRNKLRTLGVEVISDMNSTSLNVCSKISEIVSFLDIASAVNIISEMNHSILKKEFFELNQSVKKSVGEVKTIDKQIDLSEFFREELPPARQSLSEEGEKGNYIGHHNGHQYSTRVGVQKGSTLMKALSDKINNKRLQDLHNSYAQNFDIFKKQRREDIINIIKAISGNGTIKDIKDRAKSSPNEFKSLVSSSEKTLQRELVSMVKDGVLKKTGEKRWSKYFLK